MQPQPRSRPTLPRNQAASHHDSNTRESLPLTSKAGLRVAPPRQTLDGYAVRSQTFSVSRPGASRAQPFSVASVLWMAAAVSRQFLGQPSSRSRTSRPIGSAFAPAYSSARRPLFRSSRVDRISDGKSFAPAGSLRSSRSAIFSVRVFQVEEAGLDHQTAMPKVLLLKI